MELAPRKGGVDSLVHSRISLTRAVSKLEGAFWDHLCHSPGKQCGQTCEWGCSSLSCCSYTWQIWASHVTLQNLTFLMCKVSIVITAWEGEGSD